MLRQDEIIVRLSKRIGFSAGIDNLPNRLKKLTCFFEDKNLSATLLENFIRDDGLSGKSAESFILILKQLDIISTAITGAVFPNKNFLLLKNIRKMFPNDADFEFTADAIIFEILMKQDGDIFANILENNLDANSSAEMLQRMAFEKYNLLTEIYPSSIIRLKIWNQIRFSQVGGKTKIERFDQIQEEKFINLSSVEKIIQPRKSWLRNFDLIEKDEIVQDFLKKLKKLNNFKDKGCHLFWPEPYELKTFRITQNFLSENFEINFIKLCNETILKNKNKTIKEIEITKKAVLNELKDFLVIHDNLQVPWDIFVRMLSSKYLPSGKLLTIIDQVVGELRQERKINLVNLVGRGGALKIQK
jgi:hypothetical protein